MRREALGLLVAVAVVTSACSSSASRAPADAGGETIRDGSLVPGAGGETVRDGSVVPAAGGETIRDGSEVPDAGGETIRDGSEVPAAGGETIRDESDEPVFDSPPQAPLELSQFPIDDAGQGSAAPADVDALPTGWAAFDLFLGRELIRNGNTAASVAVSIDGDLVHSSAFGTRVAGTFDPTGTEDRFRVASISKTITAIVLLQLVQEGAIGLDEPIGDRVSSHLGMTSASAGSQRLTVRQLVTHTTGFGKYQSTFFGNGATDCRHAATIGLSRGSGGGGYEYSNMNYCIAGLLIEAVTGLSYEEAAYRYLLTPLGLSGLRLAPTFDPGPGEAQHQTTGGRNYMETLGGAGAWVANPSDLVVILDSLDPTTPGWKPLEDDLLRQMLTPVNGQFGQRGYGMGVILYGGGRLGHTGTIENTHAMMLNRGDGVIWAVTVAGPFPSDTPQLEVIVNRAFAAAGFTSSPPA